MYFREVNSTFLSKGSTNSRPKRSITLPLAEFLENDSVGKSLPANTNTLQDTITSQLLQNKVSFQFSRLSNKGIIHLLHSWQNLKKQVLLNPDNGHWPLNTEWRSAYTRQNPETTFPRVGRLPSELLNISNSRCRNFQVLRWKYRQQITLYQIHWYHSQESSPKPPLPQET